MVSSKAMDLSHDKSLYNTPYMILRNMVMTRFIVTVIVMLVVVLVLNRFGFSLLLQVFLSLISGLVSGIGEELGRIIINKVEEWLSERDTVVISI